MMVPALGGPRSKMLRPRHYTLHGGPGESIRATAATGPSAHYAPETASAELFPGPTAAERTPSHCAWGPWAWAPAPVSAYVRASDRLTFFFEIDPQVIKLATADPAHFGYTTRVLRQGKIDYVVRTTPA